MRTSWADSVANAESSAAATGSSASNATTAAPRHPRSAYVPPHLRNRLSSSEPPAPKPLRCPPAGRNRWGGGPIRDLGRPGFCGGRGGGGWNSRTGGWDRREREVNPFANDDETTEAAFDGQENTGINFDAYGPSLFLYLDVPLQIPCSICWS